MAIERDAMPNSFRGWSTFQLQFLSTTGLNHHDNLPQSSFSNVPLIVCKESIDEKSEDRKNTECGLERLRRDCQLQQRSVVDQREAARLANWAQPELSCEALSLQDCGKILTPKQDPLLVNESESTKVLFYVTISYILNNNYP